MGFLLGAFAIGFGGYLILQGKEISGLIALIGALAAVVVPFIYGKREQRRELDEKQEQLARPPRDDWDYTAPPEIEAGKPKQK